MREDRGHNKKSRRERRMETSTVMRIIPFSGKREDFPVFAAKFKAQRALKGMLEALDSSFEAKLPKDDQTVLDDTKEDEMKKIEAKKKNTLAMSYLTLSMNTPQLMAKIEGCKSTAWPGGLAFEMWEKLENRYKPNDTLAVAEAMQKLMSLELKRTQDPESLGDEIAAIETAFRVPMDEKQKIAAVVNASGEQYADTILMATNKAGSSVTAEDLIDAMGEKWRITSGSKETEEQPLETALSVINKKPFKFSCYSCGDKGHRANECPKKKAEWTGFSNNRVCNHCGRRGHEEKDCWDKEENKHKRPYSYKSKKEGTAGAAVEILLACVM